MQILSLNQKIKELIIAKYYRQKVVYVDDFNRAWHEVFCL